MGGGGTDTQIGETGNDELGGDGDEEFVFPMADGPSTALVTDFVAHNAEDKINLSNAAGIIAGLADLFANQPSSDEDGNAVIADADGDTMTLLYVGR